MRGEKCYEWRIQTRIFVPRFDIRFFSPIPQALGFRYTFLPLLLDDQYPHQTRDNIKLDGTLNRQRNTGLEIREETLQPTVHAQALKNIFDDFHPVFIFQSAKWVFSAFWKREAVKEFPWHVGATIGHTGNESMETRS